MNKIFIIVLSIILPIITYSQTFSEKQIFDVNSISRTELKQPYSDWLYFYYDRASGSYVYMKYDTIHEGKVKSVLFSNKGISKGYDGFYYDITFDSGGNYYTVTFDTLAKNKVVFYLIKNGIEIIKADNILLERRGHGLIYFLLYENQKQRLCSYDYTVNKLKKGNSYYMLYSEIYFTNDDKPYFLALSKPSLVNSECFLVLDGKEQKHYSDISYCSRDSLGYPVYLAKTSGKFNPYYNENKENSGMFLVWGNREYKTFESIRRLNESILDPIPLSDSGYPVYTGRAFNDAKDKYYLIVGNKKIGKSYYNFTDFHLTSDNKMVFIADITKDSQLPPFSSYMAKCLVYDGHEGKIFRSIKDLRLYPDGRYVFLAETVDSQKVIVIQDEVITPPYTTTVYAGLMSDGRFICAGWTRKKVDTGWVYESNVRIGDYDLGPFYGLAVVYTFGPYIKVNSSGNYGFLIFEKNDTSKDAKVVLFSDLGKSNEHDMILDISLINGKFMYMGYERSGRRVYPWMRRLYYNFKPVTSEYDDIKDLNIDELTKTITFTGLRDYKFFDVEIKL
jgi:hypothetical protein